MAIPVKEEAKGIFRIGPLSTKRADGRETASTGPFLVAGEKQSAIVEPGEAAQVPQLIEGIKQLGVKLDSITYIMATHIHLHHVQGAPVLLKSLPRARVVVHPRGVAHLVNVARLMESTIAVWGDKCYEPILPTPPDKVISAADGQLFDLGGRELECIYSTGHASHHMGIFDRLTRVLFAGDLDAGVGSYGPPGGPGVSPTIFDVDLHANALQRYLDLNPSMLLYFTDPASGKSSSPESLRTSLVDLRAVERICREGLRSKCTLAEIDRRVNEYNTWAKSEVFGGVEVSGRSRGSAGAPPHMIAYLLRQDPSLSMPSDLPERRGDHSARRR